MSDTSITAGLVAFGVFILIAVLICIIAYCRSETLPESDNLEMGYGEVEPSPTPPRVASKPKSAPAKAKSKPETSSTTRSTGSTAPSSRSTAEADVLRLWHDPTIRRAAIPLDEIHLSDVLSHGAYGEVYRGFYDGEPVAVKRLLRARRQDVREIATFLEEAKLMTTLRHKNIVRLVGVAWNARTDVMIDAMQDLSIVSELMEGGDLRSLLSHSYETNAPTGFHSDNLQIAIDVARALKYLHGLTPAAVVHRDLKSKNVLLTRDLNAKLTDFGVSREQAEATMTAGVGSYLWMAPEVVFGRRYDEKADVFSFGVVLSELDTHTLPYAHAKESGSGRKLTEMTIVKMVSEGALTVQFSSDADEEIVALARACVSHDPSKRPTAIEALARLEKSVDRIARASTLSSGRGMTATLTARVY